MPRTKGAVRGIPQEEEGLVDIDKLAKLIRAARVMADPELPNQKALAEAMTEAGRPMAEKRVYDLEAGRVGPSVVELFLITAITKPPGGLAHFAPAFPGLWPLLEVDLARAPRIKSFDTEPVRAFVLTCGECEAQSPVMNNVRHPGPRLDSELRRWAMEHKAIHEGGGK